MPRLKTRLQALERMRPAEPVQIVVVWSDDDMPEQEPGDTLIVVGWHEDESVVKQRDES